MTSFTNMALLAIACTTVLAQTRIDLSNQSRSVDFTGATATRPIKTGTDLPDQCTTGDLFFKVDAADGNNLYGCTLASSWNLQGGSGGGLAGGSNGDVLANSAGVPTWQPVGGDLTGPLASARVVGLAGRAVSTLQPAAGQVLQWSSITNRWEPTTVTAGSNGLSYTAGIGVALDSNVFSTDDAVIPVYYSGAGAPAIPCKAGRDFYTDSTALQLYFCGADNTWKVAGEGLPGVNVNVLGSLQACTDVGTQNHYSCSLSPAISAYQVNAHYRFLASTSNNGPATLSLNGLGSASITKYFDGALETGDIRAGQWVEVVYDGSRFQMQSQQGTPPAAGSAGFRRYAYVVGNGTATFQTLGDAISLASGTASVVALNSDGALINLATAASPAAVGYWFGNPLWQTGSNISYKALAKTVDLTSARYWLGLFSGTVAALATNDNPGTGSVAAFRYSSGTDSSWTCVTRDGTTQRETASGIAADTSSHIFEIGFSGNGTAATFRIDGASVCGASLALNLPDAVIAMRQVMSVNTKDGTSKSIRAGWAYLQTDK